MRVLILLFCLTQSLCLNAIELPEEDVTRPGIEFYFQFQIVGDDVTHIDLYRFRDDHEIYRYLVARVFLFSSEENSFVVDGKPCSRSVAFVYNARRTLLGQVAYCNGLTKDNINETIKKIVDIYVNYTSI